MGKSDSPNCELCLMNPETIEHLFFECFTVKNFWFKLIEEYGNYVQLNLSIKCSNVILKYDIASDFDNRVINILILYGKKFIYNCKMNTQNVIITNFARYMYKEVILMEKLHNNNEHFGLIKGFLCEKFDL